MHRERLLAALRVHEPFDAEEAAACARVIEFVTAHSDCFERGLAVGHVTGSAWIADPAGDRVVLVHHGKIGRWLQPGGHADGDADVARVAWREAREETGLGSLALVNDTVYDVDVHAIPARDGEAAHFHYDVRFRFVADPREHPVVTAESLAVRWVGLDEAQSLAPERSVRRMIEKLSAIGRTRGYTR